MSTFTGKKIANTYKDLLKIATSVDNAGIDGTLRSIQDGNGVNTALQLSQSEAKIAGNLDVTGTVSAAGFSVNGIDVSVLNAVEISATTINATSITVGGDNVATSSGLATVSATLESRISDVSSTFAATSAALESRINSVSANLVSTSAALQTNINTVSATLSTTNVAVSTNTSAISDIRTSISNYLPLSGGTMLGNLNMSLNTLTVPYMDIKASGTQTVFEGSGTTGVRMVADATFEIKGANRLKTMFTGGELGSTTLYYNPTTLTDPAVARIRTQVSGTTLYGDVSITSNAYVSGTIFQAGVTVANTSAVANLQTNINTVSAGLDTANTSIAANASAITALSATLETRINTVSALTQTNLDAISSVNTIALAAASASTSATLETRIAAVSSTMATSISNHLPLAGGTLTGNLILNADPTSNLMAATKAYVDNLTASGIHFHEAVRLESPIALTVTYNNGTAGVGATLTNAGTQAALVIDGITANVADRILIYEQADATQNGVYTVTDVGSASTNWVLTRSTDTDSYGNADGTTLDEGSYFFVQEGNTGAGEAYVCNTVGTITFGTTDITFVQFSNSVAYTAGTGININDSRVISTSGVPTDAELAAVSATMATSISNSNTAIAAVSVLTQTNLDAIASVNTIALAAASASTSATLETRIAAVSATMATSIGNSNTNIAAVSALVPTLSATMATSISNANAAAVAFAIALG